MKRFFIGDYDNVMNYLAEYVNYGHCGGNDGDFSDNNSSDNDDNDNDDSNDKGELF